MAVFIFKPEKITNAGTIKNPPPAPIIPVKKPTREPFKIIFELAYNLLLEVADFISFENNIKYDAESINNEKISIMRKSLVIISWPKYKLSGNAGRRYLLVI